MSSASKMRAVENMLAMVEQAREAARMTDDALRSAKTELERVKDELNLRDVLEILGDDAPQSISVDVTDEITDVTIVLVTPTVGFLMEDASGSDGVSHTAVFELEGLRFKFQAVCGCCGTHNFVADHRDWLRRKAEEERRRQESTRWSMVYGYYSPEKTKKDAEKDAEKERRRQTFKQAIEKACHEAGVETLLVKKPDAWVRQYGEIQGVSLEDAYCHASIPWLENAGIEVPEWHLLADGRRVRRRT